MAHDRAVKVGADLRCVTNKRVYAIGDAAGGLQFTHVAGYHAGVVIRSALFGLPAKARQSHIPWATYTDPEIAAAAKAAASHTGSLTGADDVLVLTATRAHAAHLNTAIRNTLHTAGLWFPPNRGGLLYAASRSGAAVFS